MGSIRTLLSCLSTRFRIFGKDHSLLTLLISSKVFAHSLSLYLLQLVLFTSSEQIVLTSLLPSASPQLSRDFDFGFASPPAKDPTKIKRELKVVTQQKLIHRVNAATFLRKKKKDRKNLSSEIHYDTDDDYLILLCLGLDSGNISVCSGFSILYITIIFDSQIFELLTDGATNNFLSSSWDFQCSWGDILSIEADPQGNNFL